MSAITNSLNKTVPEQPRYITPQNVKKAILVAVSAIMIVGMIVSYAMGASWLFTLLFFALALAPLFPLGKKVDDQRDRIIS